MPDSNPLVKPRQQKLDLHILSVAAIRDRHLTVGLGPVAVLVAFAADQELVVAERGFAVEVGGAVDVLAGVVEGFISLEV
jgi:hypothetical protein